MADVNEALPRVANIAEPAEFVAPDQRLMLDFTLGHARDLSKKRQPTSINGSPTFGADGLTFPGDNTTAVYVVPTVVTVTSLLIELWVKVAADELSYLAGLNVSGTERIFFGVHTSGRAIIYDDIGDEDDANYSAGGQYSLNTWHHIVYRVHHTHKRAYIDGKKVIDFEGNTSIASMTTPTLTIGSNINSGAGDLNGTIATCNIWFSDMCEQEIRRRTQRGRLWYQIEPS